LPKPIALQLYTVRNLIEKEGLAKVLRRVADIGYAAVETAGLHGIKPEDYSNMVRDLGMDICSSHVDMPTPDNVNQLIDTQLSLGCRKVISGFGPEQFLTFDGIRQAVDIANTAGDLLRSSGLIFGLHNHWWEFAEIDGQYPYDLLMSGCPDVFGELDVYWAAFAGANPADIIARYKSRLPLLHIKDGSLQKDSGHVAVGSGALDMPNIVHSADPHVLEWLIVELDECSTDMFEAVRKSYGYLTRNALATGISQ
jgi:sugar phosphate isomerase/epimerase